MHDAITITIKQYIRNYELNLIFRRHVVITVEIAMSFYCKSTKRLQLKQKTASKLKIFCLNYSCYWKDQTTYRKQWPLLRFLSECMIEDAKRPRSSLYGSLATGPTPKKLCAPPRRYTSSFEWKYQLAQVSRRSAGPPLPRGPIGSNRSNRLKAGPAVPNAYPAVCWFKKSLLQSLQ